MERELFGLTAGGLADAEEDTPGVSDVEGSDGVEARYGWLERLVAESAGVSVDTGGAGWGLGIGYCDL